MRVKVVFVAEFETEIEVPDDASYDDIMELASDVEIPETKESKYLEDTFEVVHLLDTDGHTIPDEDA